eukprot:UN04912
MTKLRLSIAKFFIFVAQIMRYIDFSQMTQIVF